MFSTCSTAAETLNKILEQRPHGSLTVRDGNGRAINIDELTTLCELERTGSHDG
jgi:hypothetical protein